jgi:hypothetical protein
MCQGIHKGRERSRRLRWEGGEVGMCFVFVGGTIICLSSVTYGCKEEA